MSRFSDDSDGPYADRGDDRPGLDDLEPGVELLGDVLEDDADDYPEDAAEEDIDLIVALYREDGQPVALALSLDLANDLEGLIQQLRRIPGDGGAVGLVSIAQEFFVIVRVRGKHVQVLLSDELAATDWPIARDVADFLNDEIIDEDDDDPIGDLGILSDLGVSEFDLETLIDNLDFGSDQMLLEIADKINIGAEFRRVVETSFRH